MTPDMIRKYASLALNKWKLRYDTNPVAAQLELNAATLILQAELAAQLSELNNPRTIKFTWREKPVHLKASAITRVGNYETFRIDTLPMAATLIQLMTGSIQCVDQSLAEVEQLLSLMPSPDQSPVSEEPPHDA
jgi:hypothetical protein